VTGHEGILPVDGALLAPIVPHISEIQQATRPALLDRGAGPHQAGAFRWSVSYLSEPVACPTEESGAVPDGYSRITLDGT
jgi:hypothetical protein